MVEVEAGVITLVIKNKRFERSWVSVWVGVHPRAAARGLRTPTQKIFQTKSLLLHICTK